MPLLFDIYNGELTCDEEGLELADDRTAEKRAHFEACISQPGLSSARPPHLSHRIEVKREDGMVFTRVRFGEAVEVRP